MTDEKEAAPQSDGGDAGILDLGEDFEVLDDTGSTPASPEGASQAAPAAASGPAPATGGAPGSPPRVRSEAAWTGLGLGLAVAGLLGPWGPVVGSNLLHGLLLAWTLWFLLTRGLAAVQPPGGKGGTGPLLPGLLAVYGLARCVLAGSGALESALGWSAGGGLLECLGAVATLVGGALALAAPALARKKDAALPPPGEAPARDTQFSQSLLAYLLVLVGLLLPWSLGAGGLPERGADALFGALTLLCAVLMVWASWVGYWKLWTMPVVTGRLGVLLFLAPLEAVLLGLAGIARHTVQREQGWLFDTWPGDPDRETFLVHGAGPLLLVAGGSFGLWVLFHGTKAAMAMAKERKAQEIAARKAAREKRRSNAGQGR